MKREFVNGKSEVKEKKRVIVSVFGLMGLVFG